MTNKFVFMAVGLLTLSISNQVSAQTTIVSKSAAVLQPTKVVGTPEAAKLLGQKDRLSGKINTVTVPGNTTQGTCTIHFRCDDQQNGSQGYTGSCSTCCSAYANGYCGDNNWSNAYM